MIFTAVAEAIELIKVHVKGIYTSAGRDDLWAEVEDMIDEGEVAVIC